MASTNKTAKLGLNQWVLTDPLLMEDMNADNQKIDEAVGALSYVKLMDITTAANAQQVDLDVSAIDFTKYAMIQVFVSANVTPLNTATYLYAKINNGGAYIQENGSSSIVSRAYVGFVVTSDLDGYFNNMKLEITGIPNVLNAVYLADIKTSGSCCHNEGNFYVYDQHAVKQMSANTGVTTINFLTDMSYAFIKAGSRFEIYGVKK